MDVEKKMLRLWKAIFKIYVYPFNVVTFQLANYFQLANIFNQHKGAKICYLFDEPNIKIKLHILVKSKEVNFIME
jgi:hypothetical protein